MAARTTTNPLCLSPKKIAEKEALNTTNRLSTTREEIKTMVEAVEVTFLRYASSSSSKYSLNIASYMPNTAKLEPKFIIVLNIS